MATAAAADIVVSELRGKVKWIRFNRPEVRNAIAPESADRVREELERSVGEGARVIVLTGNGGAFCAGADLKALGPRMGEFTGVRSVLVDHYHPMLKTMTELPLPVIAAVDGSAAGIGSDIALAADIRLASSTCFFAEIFVNIGLIPDGGGTFTLPRLVGLGRALEMAMTGMRVGAEQALAWGLVNQVFPAAEFEKKVDEYATALADKAPLSIARTKAAMRGSVDGGTYAAALEREAELQQELFVSHDFMEGVTAFLEKRPPRFQGK